MGYLHDGHLALIAELEASITGSRSPYS